MTDGPSLTWPGRHEPESAALRPLRPRERVELADETAGGRLIHGDNGPVLAALAGEVAGRVALAYLDPPFNSGGSYRSEHVLGPDGRRGSAGVYADRWSSVDYLQMVYERLVLLRAVMAGRGVVCVHVDHHEGHRVRVLLDEVFGAQAFRNELIWRYGKMSNPGRRFANAHDTLLVYAPGGAHVFHPVREADSEYRTRFARYLAEDQTVRFGAVRTSTDRLIARRVRQRVRELGRPIEDDDILFDFRVEFKLQDDVFYDVPIVKGNSRENLGFDTQKPERLLRRLIGAYTDPGSLVLDCFAGSGTTASAAEQLGRDWISIDSSARAVHVVRKRLVAQGGRGFTVDAVDSPPDGPVGPVPVRAWRAGDAVHVELAPAAREQVDYWAIGPETAAGDAFADRWRSFRSRADPSLIARTTVAPTDRGYLAARTIDADGVERRYRVDIAN